jgi:hypothetical protein
MMLVRVRVGGRVMRMPTVAVGTVLVLLRGMRLCRSLRVRRVVAAFRVSVSAGVIRHVVWRIGGP